MCHGTRDPDRNGIAFDNISRYDLSFLLWDSNKATVKSRLIMMEFC